MGKEKFGINSSLITWFYGSVVTHSEIYGVESKRVSTILIPSSNETFSHGEIRNSSASTWMAQWKSVVRAYSLLWVRISFHLYWSLLPSRGNLSTVTLSSSLKTCFILLNVPLLDQLSTIWTYKPWSRWCWMLATAMSFSLYTLMMATAFRSPVPAVSNPFILPPISTSLSVFKLSVVVSGMSLKTLVWM